MTTLVTASVIALAVGVVLTVVAAVMMSRPRGVHHDGVSLTDLLDRARAIRWPGQAGPWADEPATEDVPGDDEPIEQGEEPQTPAPYDPLTSPLPANIVTELRLIPTWSPEPLADDVMRSGVTCEVPRLDLAKLAELDDARAAT